VGLGFGIAIPSSWISNTGLCILSVISNSEFCLRICAGLMLAKTGNHCNFVDLTVSVILRGSFRSSVSINLQWVLPSRTREQYSATK